jgi:hypothetical protein
MCPAFGPPTAPFAPHFVEQFTPGVSWRLKDPVPGSPRTPGRTAVMLARRDEMVSQPEL